MALPVREERKCSFFKKIGHIIIFNDIKLVIGNEEEVGNGCWVGKPAASATALDIPAESILA